MTSEDQLLMKPPARLGTARKGVPIPAAVKCPRLQNLVSEKAWQLKGLHGPLSDAALARPRLVRGCEDYLKGL